MLGEERGNTNSTLALVMILFTGRLLMMFRQIEFKNLIHFVSSENLCIALSYFETDYCYKSVWQVDESFTYSGKLQMKPIELDWIALLFFSSPFPPTNRNLYFAMRISLKSTLQLLSTLIEI